MARQDVQKRSGAVVLEAIIALPILMIAVIAIVELGLLSSNQTLLHAATVAGADAAVNLGCALPTSGTVPDAIIDAVQAALECQGIAIACIRVEHTNGPDGPYVLESGLGASPPIAPVPTSDYACVSVCVENTQLAPNMLAGLCVDLINSFSQQTVCRCLPNCEDNGGGGDPAPVPVGSGFIPGTSGGRPPNSNPASRRIQLSSGGGGNLQVTIFDDGSWTANDGSWQGTWSGDPTSGSVTIDTAVMP